MTTRATLTQILRTLRSLILQHRPWIFRRADLSCACGFSSFVIWRALQELGVQAEVVIGTWSDNTHAWVEAGGFILDVTLTQFEPSQPEIKVAVASRCKLYAAKVRNDAALEEFQRGADDPESWGDQSPYSHLDVVDLILRKFREEPNYSSFSPRS